MLRTIICTRSPFRGRTRRLGLLVASLLLAGLAPCAEASATEAEDAKGATEINDAASSEPTSTLEDVRKLMRGTYILLRNVAATRSFDKSVGYTYDPYAAIELKVRPQFWVHDKVYINASIGLSTELTHSNYSTYADEVFLSDLQLGVGSPSYLTIPVVGIDLGASFGMTFPLSKSSQYQTLMVALTPEISISRSFDVLAGISLGYSFSATKFFNEYTTSENAADRYPGCSTSVSVANLATSSCLNTGVRNSSARLVNAFSFSISFIPEFGLALSGALVHDFLYDQSEQVLAVGDTPIENTDIRYYVSTGATLYARPIPAIGLSLGISTSTQQLHSDPNITYRNPLFDPLRTNVFLDIKLDVAGMLSMLQPEDQ